MARLRTSADAATRELRAMGATPPEPFPGNAQPWRARHDRCGREITPSLGNARRHGGVCRFCAAEDRGLKKRLRHAEAADAAIRAAGWEPLEPYPGADVPWRVRHLACQMELHRSYNTIRSKPQSCNTCYRTAHGHHIWTVESATEVFREIGLTPLEPYPGSSTNRGARDMTCAGVRSLRDWETSPRGRGHATSADLTGSPMRSVLIPRS